MDQFVPLIVDLDGTLIKTDLLYESYFHTIAQGVPHHLKLLTCLRKGKAHLKRFLATVGRLDYAQLPYDDAVLDLIQAAREQGQPVYLASACDAQHADAIAAHLGVFEGVFASDGTTNLSGAVKAKVLVDRFGAQGFDYVGNGTADLAVWAEARKAYYIRASNRLERRLGQIGVPTRRLNQTPVSPRSWIKAIRVHQYAKNTLVFVPLLTAHDFSLTAIMRAILAFAAFSACASGIYLVNDLVDLGADRQHPKNRGRPLASGEIPIAQGLLAAFLLTGLAACLALLITPSFAGILAAYLALTTAYSLSLKRKMIIDTVVLALLYTMRIIGGAASIGVPTSEWLLAFSMFIFLSLALMKRYVELATRIDGGLLDPGNRDYKLGDTSIVAALSAASGFNAVTIFSLYIASPSVQALYSRPILLWLMCPILIYWIGRALMLAHRRIMDDDPIVFAIRDRISLLTVALMIVIVVAAI
jgi:4-hydroxybenzoate polyprenyltransferase